MNAQSLDQVKEWFAGYVAGFRQSLEELPFALALKLEHSRHVAENARDIARDLGWNPDSVRQAEVLGWLHDVGRFSQFAEFGHFHDATSVNHGIRLDIYRVVADELARDGFQDLVRMWPHVDLQGPVNPLILQDIRTRHDGDINHVKSLSDFLMLQASWIYSLNYSPTRERVRDRRILETLSVYLPHDPAVQELIGEIREYLSDEDEREQAPETLYTVESLKDAL